MIIIIIHVTMGLRAFHPTCKFSITILRVVEGLADVNVDAVAFASARRLHFRAVEAFHSRNSTTCKDQDSDKQRSYSLLHFLSFFFS